MNNLKLKRILNLKGIGQEQEHHVLLMLTHGLILTSEFDTTKVTEVEMAKNHLQDFVPNATPTATGSIIFSFFKKIGPNITPTEPVIKIAIILNITTPPYSAETSIPIGAVTDLGNIETIAT